MEVLLFGAVAIGILLYILKPFEWRSFGKSLALPPAISGLAGTNAYEKVLFAILKAVYAIVNFSFQYLKFCIKCAVKIAMNMAGKGMKK